MYKKNTSDSNSFIFYSVITFLLILLLLASSSMGFFGSGIYDSFSPPKYVQESRGQDLITLTLGIPLILLALWGFRKKRLWAVPLWTGVLAYELYVYAIYCFGGVYNKWFLSYVAIAALSLYSIIGLLRKADNKSYSGSGFKTAFRIPVAVFFLLIALIFGAIWIGEILKTISTGVVNSGELIFLFDLIIVLPAFVITSIKLIKNEPFGRVLAGTLLIKFDSLAIAIVIGQIFRYLGKIELEPQLLIIFISLGLVSFILTGFYFLSLRHENIVRE